MASCARCGSQQHATQACPLPFHKLQCSLCGKSHPGLAVCPMVTKTLQRHEREERKTLQRHELEERKQREKLDRQVDALLKKEDLNRKTPLSRDDTVTDGAGVEWRRDAQTGWWWWRDSSGQWQWKNLRYTPKSKSSRGDAASSSGETRSVASSVSTAATLAVGERRREEYEELQRMQKKLSEIASLQDRKDRGEVLSKHEESTIRRKGEFYYAPVMVKLRKETESQSLEPSDDAVVDLASLD